MLIRNVTFAQPVSMYGGGVQSSVVKFSGGRQTSDQAIVTVETAEFPWVLLTDSRGRSGCTTLFNVVGRDADASDIEFVAQQKLEAETKPDAPKSAPPPKR